MREKRFFVETVSTPTACDYCALSDAACLRPSTCSGPSYGQIRVANWGAGYSFVIDEAAVATNTNLYRRWGVLWPVYFLLLICFTALCNTLTDVGSMSTRGQSAFTRIDDAIESHYPCILLQITEFDVGVKVDMICVNQTCCFVIKANVVINVFILTGNMPQQLPWSPTLPMCGGAG